MFEKWHCGNRSHHSASKESRKEFWPSLTVCQLLPANHTFPSLTCSACALVTIATAPSQGKALQHFLQFISSLITALPSHGHLGKPVSQRRGLCLTFSPLCHHVAQLCYSRLQTRAGVVSLCPSLFFEQTGVILNRKVLRVMKRCCRKPKWTPRSGRSHTHTLN